MNNFCLKNQHKGFTLPEIMVAMSVLTLVVFAATQLLVGAIRANTENTNTIIAYGLAQEALEGVRNIRDSNWLLGAKFSGVLSSSDLKIWGETFPENPGDEKYYILDFGVFVAAQNLPSVPSALIGNTPWKLQQIDRNVAVNPEAEETHIKKFAVNSASTSQVYYGHEGLTNSGNTPFHRYLIIKNISNDATRLQKIRVSSVITWKEYGRKKEVRLDTELTDWKD